MISLTHFLFGLSLAYMLEKRLITSSGFALVPDFDLSLDFLYPFTSDGIMHSFLAAGIATALVYIYAEDFESAQSCFIGYAGAGLGLDLLTNSGVPLFFPFFENFKLSFTSAYSLPANLTIIIASLVLIMLKKHEIVSIDFLKKV